MKKKKIDIHLDDFPAKIRPILTGADIYDSSCSSNATVLFIAPDLYLKIDTKGELAIEAAMTRYFHALSLGVEVIMYLSEEKDCLVTQSALGQDLTHYLEDPKRLCQVMADTLRRLHSFSIEGNHSTGNMPISLRHQRYLDSAGGEIDGGYYDESVLMDRYPIRSKQEAWQIMQENKHHLRADTLIHGDYCLPNVVLDKQEREGGYPCTTLIDVALAGMGDRHIDLYWAIWSLQYNLGTDSYTDYFLDCYGRENFDEGMLRVIAAFEVFG